MAICRPETEPVPKVSQQGDADHPTNLAGGIDHSGGDTRLLPWCPVLFVPTRRPMIRYCVDRSEQRHHLAGALGAALLSRLVDLDWVRRSPTSRAVQVIDAGRSGLAANFGIELSCADDRAATSA